jgi:chromosome segregation ATPase
MDANDKTSTEISNAGIDLDQARARIASAKVEIAAAELTIAAEEFRLAEKNHAELSAECETAQANFDVINKKVEAHQHLVYQSIDRKNSAASALDTEQRNPPQPDWDGGGYRPGARAEWRARIDQAVEAQKLANAAVAPVSGELTRLQADRRFASTKLADLTWKESAERTMLESLRRKVSSLQPKIIPAAPRAWEPPVEADNGIMTLSSTGLRPH